MASLIINENNKILNFNYIMSQVSTKRGPPFLLIELYSRINIFTGLNAPEIISILFPLFDTFM